MTVHCPSCRVGLRVNEERLAGRTSARCPRCGGAVPLTAESSGTVPGPLRVTCGTCGVKLKAPAARAGSRSRCPKCGADVFIPAGAVPAGPPRAQEESSGAATRRIDSRSLGLPGPGAPPPSAGIDLDAFIREGSAAPPIAAPEDRTLTPADPGMAASLMNPPVARMEKIAEEIRGAAESFAPDGAASTGATPPAIRPAVRQTAETKTVVPPLSRRAATPLAPPRGQVVEEPFPARRGLIAGGAAGLVIGTASAAMSFFGLGAFVARVPLLVDQGGPAGLILHVALPALLGAVAGLIAAGAGSPLAGDNPLSYPRCVGAALLAGLAFGLGASVMAGTGLHLWPAAAWMRDLLLVGLLSPAVNRILARA